jgi:hypothetical protein
MGSGRKPTFSIIERLLTNQDCTARHEAGQSFNFDGAAIDGFDAEMLSFIQRRMGRCQVFLRHTIFVV